RLPAEALIADVAGDQQAAPALGLHQALGFVGILPLVEEDDADIRPLAREKDRHRPPDAAVAAGNQRHLAIELATALVLAAFSPGFGAHTRFEAGLMRLMLSGQGLLFL